MAEVPGARAAKSLMPPKRAVVAVSTAPRAKLERKRAETGIPKAIMSFMVGGAARGAGRLGRGTVGGGSDVGTTWMMSCDVRMEDLLRRKG